MRVQNAFFVSARYVYDMSPKMRSERSKSVSVRSAHLLVSVYIKSREKFGVSLPVRPICPRGAAHVHVASMSCRPDARELTN